MQNPKTILVVHAADADQHLGHFKKILDELKAENRIHNYTVIDSSVVNESSFSGLGSEDMVTVLLTNDIINNKVSIENWLSDVKKQSEVKAAEILIDNIPYETSFIAFPTNLKPIRANEDMDSVWQGIANNFERLFPKPEIKPLPPPPTPPPPPKRSKWKKYLPYILAIASILILSFIWYESRDKDVEEAVAVEETFDFMANSDLVEDVAKDADLSKVKTMGALKVFVNIVEENLKKGNRVYLRGLGTWKVTEKNGKRIVAYTSGYSKTTGIKTIEIPFFAQELNREIGLSSNKATKLLKALSVNIEKSLKLEKAIGIDGFGEWYIDVRPARTGRNPSTGQTIEIAEKKTIKFKVAAELDKAMN